MRLTRFTCRGFRGLAETSFDPSPGINIIQGGNAQGKTSLLEAILYAATARSHRTNTDSELVQYGAEGFSLRAQATRCDREYAVEAISWKGVKRFKVNGVPQTRISDILGKINVVMFSPEDVGLVKGGGAARRRFLDMALSQINAPYLYALQQYRQALRQRNELLRDTPRMTAQEEALLDVWDAQLIQHGQVLIRERQAFLVQLGRYAVEAYTKIASTEKTEAETLRVAYEPDVESPEALQPVLIKARPSDIRRRATQRGPHRDDIAILIADKIARNFASQGQQRTAALALRLAEVALAHERTQEYPILMLDEVLAELDPARSRHLFDAIGPEVQCLMTTAQPARSIMHQEDSLPTCTLFTMENGVLAHVE